MKRAVLILTTICLTNSYANYAGGFAQGLSDGIERARANELRANANAVLEEQRRQNLMMNIKKDYLNKMTLRLIKYERLIQDISHK